MNIEEYRRRRNERLIADDRRGRRICPHCLQPNFTCYCRWLNPFDPGVDFVILIHPKEFRRAIASGRMAHLMLKGSSLITGEDFTNSASLNSILHDPNRSCLILYPRPPSLDLSKMKRSERLALFETGKRLTLIIIDGTWNTARKMIRLSQNLAMVKRVGFIPREPSNFRVRKQPSIECLSTIEAVAESLDLLGADPAYAQALTDLFEKVVNRRLELAHSYVPL